MGLKYNPLLKLGFEDDSSANGGFNTSIFKVSYYELTDISTLTSGSLQEAPIGATINEGEFGESGNSVLSTLTVTDKPTFQDPLDGLGDPITINLSTDGTWIASDIYPDQVALIYSLSIQGSQWTNLDQTKIIDFYQIVEGHTNKIRTVTTNYLADINEFVLVNVSGGELTITIPLAASVVGKEINIKKIDTSSNKVYIDGGAETIDGDLIIYLISQNESVTLVSNGTNWNIK